MRGGDVVVACRDCSAKFVFTAGEQEFFKEKGFDGTPVRCKECRAAKKGGGKGGKGGERSNVCYAFQRGECTRGDSCKFDHGGASGGGRGAGGGRGKGGFGVCYAFQRGECTRGDSCKFEHSAGGSGRGGGGKGRGRGGGNGKGKGKGGAKAGVCYAFQKGECTRGTSCRFAH